MCECIILLEFKAQLVKQFFSESVSPSFSQSVKDAFYSQLSVECFRKKPILPT